MESQANDDTVVAFMCLQVLITIFSTRLEGSIKYEENTNIYNYIKMYTKK